MPLADYRDLVGTLANVVTIGQFFSGVFICKDIVKQGNTKNVQATPFIGGVGMSVLFLKYANIIKDPGMVPVNVVGIIINMVYLLCYYLYTQEKVQFITTISKSLIFFGSILAYVAWEDPDKVEFRFGLLTTVLMFMLIASPLLQLGEVMRTQSTESLPFPIIFSGTIVTFLWLLYGIIIDNAFIQIQNLVGFLLSVVQLSLFIVYPSKPKKEKKKSN